MVQLLQHTQIDFNKWDACILRASNADPFLLSSWLNVVEANWSAFVADDYAAVFPIFQTKKMRWSFFDLPNFVQKLSVYGDARYEKEIAECLKELHATIDYVCYTTDERLVEDVTIKRIPRRHQILQLQEGVRFPTKVWGRNIRKAEASGFTELAAVPIDVFVPALKKELIEKGNPYKKADYILLEALARQSIHAGYGFIEGIKDEAGAFTCGQFYIYMKGRIYLVACFSNERAREHSLLHYLLYKIIQQKYGLDTTMRVHFGGSNIPVIADFNKNFGATDEQFVLAYKNNLPFWFRIFKHA
ncbi:hypothetical protein [Cytophaga aurantiaca]|uniref:hypothetical protein n=1 Tax=Cytophaga aurantiaca TaxID=29530 RepID=UPI0003A10B4E|nr:hypothetical protein [Cytophaga aurantiaca]